MLIRDIEGSHGPITANQLLFYKNMVEACPFRLNRKFNFCADFLFHYDGNGKVHISSFKLDKRLRGKGIGDFSMREVTSFADRFDVTLYLLPAVLDELKLFYQKHGFDDGVLNSAYITRVPR